MRQTNAIYRMLFRVILPQRSVEVNIAAFDLKVWHERLGHVGGRALVEMVKSGLVDGVKIKKIEKFFCEPCQLGKSHRLPFKKEQEDRNTKPGELIHMDVCGKIQVESLGGANYYVTFIDDAINFCYVYFIKHKDDVFEKFKIFQSIVANKFGTNIKNVRSDSGTEYKNTKMRTYLEERGIIMENSTIHVTTKWQSRKGE